MNDQQQNASSTKRNSDQIDVIYIAGYGRSGSTILELLLGGIPGFHSVGETTYLWNRGCLQNLSCSCGVEFWRCPIWPDIVTDVVGKVSCGTFKKIDREQRRAKSIARMPFYLRNPEALRSQRKETLTVLDKLYRSLARRTKAKVLIDSSKIPGYGLLLSHLPSVRLHVIHLTRDSRAVAFSWTRRKRRPEIHWREDHMPRYSAVRTALKWNVHNKLSESLERTAANYHRLRYEDVASHPGTMIDEMLQRFGLLDANAIQEVRRLRKSPTLLESAAHSVSGNPIRFLGDDRPVALDHKWKSEMSRFSQSLVQALTWRLQEKYGYGDALHVGESERIDSSSLPDAIEELRTT